MSKPAGPESRQDLPPGWDWADWSKKDDAKAFWDGEADLRGRFMVRFMEITASLNGGRMLPHEKVFCRNGVCKAKLRRPSPGWRAWFIRQGQTCYLTHFTKGTSKGEQDEQEAVALKAWGEHKAKHTAPPTTRRTKSRKRRRGR